MRAVLLPLLSIILTWAWGANSAETVPNGPPPEAKTSDTASQSVLPLPLGEHSCLPYYPAMAMRMNQQGAVTVDVGVSPQGAVTDVRVVKSSGFDALDDAAVNCAKERLYRPAIRNGVPIAGQSQATIKFALGEPPGGQFAGAEHTAVLNWVRSPLWSPPPPRPGWSRDKSSETAGGVIMAYKFSASDPASDQYVSAGAYSNVPSLDEFIANHDASLQSIADSASFTERRIMVCGDMPAWEAEYSRSGLVPNSPRQSVTIKQVAVVTNGTAYLATYIRPGGSSPRPDADEWIHTYCKPKS